MKKKNLFSGVLVLILTLLILPNCTKKPVETGKVLNLVVTAKLKGLDPAFASDLYSSTEVNRVYESLFQYHYLKRPYVLVPLLAQSMPKISKDKLTYTINVRKNVFFHNDPAFPQGKGRELVAKDFIYSLMRIADPNLHSTGWWILENRIQGLDKWREEMKAAQTTDYSKGVSGLRLLGKYTLKIKLKDPYPQLLNILAMPYTSAVPEEVVNKYGPEFINHAIGTGPFILKFFKPSEQVIYEKNPIYWGHYPKDGGKEDRANGLLADAGKSLPLVDKVKVRVIVESQPRWMHFLNSELDIVAVPKDNFSDAITPNLTLTKKFKEKNIRLSILPSLDIAYTSFNLESEEIPQFRNKRVRRAISIALSSESERFIKIFYNGFAIKAQTPIPPGITGYRSDYLNPYKRGGLQRAKKMLADAGYPNGKGIPVIPFDIVSSTNSRQIAEFQIRILEKLGLKFKLIASTWPEFQKRIQRRQTHFWSVAWAADYPDAENFLQLFYGKNAQPGGMNGSYYKNKNFDRIFTKARKMQDSSRRTRLYEKLSRIISSDVPVILNVHRKNVVLIQPYLKNYKHSEFPVNVAKYLDVEKDMKRGL